MSPCDRPAAGHQRGGRAGQPARHGAIRPRIEAALAALDARFAGRLPPVSDALVRRWGAISGAVKRATGQTPPVIDTMLAATALEHDIHLVTRNVHDVQHSGAAVFNPWIGDSALGRLQKRTRRGGVIRKLE